MSYILDALKKSEQERQRGAVPDVLTLQEEFTTAPEKKPRWLYIALPLMAVMLSGILWFIISGHDKKPVEHSMADHKPVAVRPAVQSKEEDAKAEMNKSVSDRQEPLKKETLHPVAPAENRAVKASFAPPQTVNSTESVKKPEDKPEAVLQPKIAPPSDPNRIYNLKELPTELQKSLPRFSLSAFMYAENPSSRMVRINDQMMREGQELGHGIKLIEIAPDGVVLAANGYRFFIGMK